MAKWYLAAAEVVATILGRPADSHPDELKNLPLLALPSETSDQAVAAIDAMLAHSDLKDCWEETDDFEKWEAAVRLYDLLINSTSSYDRLQPSIPIVKCRSFSET